MKNNRLFVISSFFIAFIIILMTGLISNVQFKYIKKISYNDELSLGDTVEGCKTTETSLNCSGNWILSGSYCYSESKGNIPYNVCVNNAGGYYASNGICYGKKSNPTTVTKCTECKSNYDLQSNGSCKKKVTCYKASGINTCRIEYESQSCNSSNGMYSSESDCLKSLGYEKKECYVRNGSGKCSLGNSTVKIGEECRFSTQEDCEKGVDNCYYIVGGKCQTCANASNKMYDSLTSCNNGNKQRCLDKNDIWNEPSKTCVPNGNNNVCSKGYWRNESGCVQCSLNYYCPDESGNRKYCGDNFVTDARGAKSADACHCKDGYHKFGNSCVPNSTSTNKILLSPIEPLKQEVTYDKNVASITGYDPITCTKSGQKVTCSISDSFDQCGEKTATVSFTDGGSSSLEIVYRGKWKLAGTNVCYLEKKTLTRKNNEEKQAWEGEWFDHEKNKWCYSEYYTRCNSGGGDPIPHDEDPPVIQDPVYACYRTSDYKLYWASEPKFSGDVKLSSVDKEDCNDQNFCKGETVNGKKNVEQTCENTITIKDIKSGASCSIKNSYFYEIECKEGFVASYLPELKGKTSDNAYTLVTGINKLTTGFDSTINLSTVKQCTGTFNKEKYDNIYQMFSNNLTKAKSSGDVAGKYYYENLILELQSYVEDYYDYKAQYADNNSEELVNITGTISFKYNNGTEKNYNYEVKKTQYNVQTVETAFSCKDMPGIEDVLSSMENEISCDKECTTKTLNNKISTECKTRLDYRQCATEVVNSCKNTCMNRKKSVTLNTLRACNSTSKTLADGKKVTPFTTTVTESYLLQGPEVYLDKSGKVVTDSSQNNLINGGHKFYLDYIKVGNNYKITTRINGLGMNKSSSITNKNCEFMVITNENALKYRIIDTENPFVNTERLNSLNNNWKNSIYDFTNEIKGNTSTLYTFDLSKQDIEEIKDDNVRYNAYLGLCNSNSKEHGVIGRICSEINK